MQEKYALDDEMLKPYFKLENVQKGVFDLATRLYGITFKEVNNIPLYHPEVKPTRYMTMTDRFLPFSTRTFPAEAREAEHG